MEDYVRDLTDPLGHATVVGFDAVGNQITEKDPVGNVTTFAYDQANRLTTVADPGGGTHTYIYDNANEKTDSTDADGRRATYAYDKDGRETGETWLTASGGALRVTTYVYDNVGQMTGVTDPDATLTYTYDPGGRMTSAVTHGTAGQPTVTLTYGYDNANNQTSVTDSLSSIGRTTYAYDAANRLTTITRTLGGSSGPRVILGYDDGGQTTSLARTIGGAGTAVTTSMAYDAASRLTTLTHQVAGGSALASYVYGYDNANRVSSEKDDGGAAVSYAYDSSDQLATVTGGRSETYTYDAAGNRSMAGYATTTFDRLTSGAGYTYVYDGDGNLTSKRNSSTGAVTSFAWDYHDRLTGITQKNSGGTILHQVTYTYDALGDRIGVDEDGTQTWTAYDGQNSYADFSGGGTLRQRYLYGPAVDEILARTGGAGTTAWYLTDRQGSVRNVSDTSGHLTATVTYDSYGRVLSDVGSGADRFLYTGREYDSFFGLQYNRARYYDAAIGRWVSEDPMQFSLKSSNPYYYVNNNPINLEDPSGKYAVIYPSRWRMSQGYDERIHGPIFYPEIVVKLNITLYGTSATSGLATKWKKAIENEWNGKGYDYKNTSLKVIANISVSSWYNPSIGIFNFTTSDNAIDVITTSPGQGAINTIPFTGVGSHGWIDASAPDKVVAHEAGHLMGLSDEYSLWTAIPYESAKGTLMGDPGVNGSAGTPHTYEVLQSVPGATSRGQLKKVTWHATSDRDLIIMKGLESDFLRKPDGTCMPLIWYH